ncbi:KamA family radical SAM protein [Cohnella massiliensis]|uniref:KamA family radical SAM protein n=2 Tax=Cohnella TaxID=329857 RepID=UPI0009B98D47|nr:KamA family radical SAM protein [Cohnella massiliensis]
MSSSRSFHNVGSAAAVPGQENRTLPPILGKLGVRLNEYYMSLIDWKDPADPLRRLIVPSTGQLKICGGSDGSCDDAGYDAPGCRHIYRNTALLRMPDAVRVRELRGEPADALSEIAAGIDYIARRKEIDNVALAGGDGLAIGSAALRDVLERLCRIDHVRVIRIHSKLPLFNPKRISENEALLQLIGEYSKPERRIFVMATVHHPREVTPEASRAFQALREAHAIVMGHVPILRGVNDSSGTLRSLLDRLAGAGVAPDGFYIYPPDRDNRFSLPLGRVYELVEGAKASTSVPGKSVKLAMNHPSGKIEILAVENRKAYLKYHQSKHYPYGKFMMLECPPSAVWFDDLPGSERYWPVPETAAPGKRFDDSPGDAARRQANHIIAD